MCTRTQSGAFGVHGGAVVVALGIYVADAGAIDATLIVDAQRSVVPPASGLRDLVDSATHGHELRLDRLAVSYPAWWDSFRVDRLLRDVRTADLMVNRYLTSGEAAVRWWRHVGGDATSRAGTMLVHDVTAGSPHVTLVRFDAGAVETVASGVVALNDIELDDLEKTAQRLVDSALVSAPDSVPTLLVGCAGSDYEHAVALGTALGATL